MNTKTSDVLVKTTELVVKTSYVAAVIAAILAAYRLMVILFFSDSGNLIMTLGNLTIMGFFAAMAGYLWVYGNYRDNEPKSNETKINEQQLMKVFSFLAGVCCLLRALSTVLYFSQMETINSLTEIYVYIEVLLWLVLTVYFYLVWKKRSHRIERMMDKL